jgi:long-chain acyl-CoA synthetase
MVAAASPMPSGTLAPAKGPDVPETSVTEAPVAAEPAPPVPHAPAHPDGLHAPVTADGPTVCGLFDAVVRQFADRPALHYFDRTYTYAELGDGVNRLAAGLASLGVGPGDRVALHLPNCPEYAEAFFAALKCGAAVVQVSPLLAPPEIDWCLMRSGAKVLVTMDMLLPAVKSCRAQRRLAATLVADSAGHLTYWRRWAGTLWRFRERYALYGGLGGTWDHFESALRKKGTLPEGTVVTPSTDAVLQPTGGTTGRQKFAVLTHGNLVANARQVSLVSKTQPGAEGECVLAAPPLTHAYGLTVSLLCGLFNGAAVALLPSFKPEQALQTMAERGVTVAPLVPPMAATLVREARRAKEKDAKDAKDSAAAASAKPRYDLSKLRYAICGGAALPPDLMKEFEAVLGRPILQGYGLSEASPVTHTNPVDGENRAGSIGVPLPDTQARIVNDQGEEVGVGEVGELQVKGPQVMRGYLGGEDERGIRDGWLPTGDLARRDADGYYHLTGRSKKMILTNGLNVYPCEVEEVLRLHPCVAEAAAVAEPHPARGEVVKALIVPAEGCVIDTADLTAFCRERIAGYKVPRTFEMVPALPGDLSDNLRRPVYPHRPPTHAGGHPFTGSSGVWEELLEDDY